MIEKGVILSEILPPFRSFNRGDFRSVQMPASVPKVSESHSGGKMATSASFIGLGNMGSAMARNLLRNGTRLFVYNRSKNKASELLQEGAQLLHSPKEAFLRAPIAFSMVANDQALTDITEGIEGLLENGKPGCVHVSMSTVSPKLSRYLAEKHQEKGVEFISAPVFGRPEAAAQQNLIICMAGSHKGKKQIEPLLRILGKKIYDFGEDPSHANVVKLTGNFMILANIELMAEAFAFAKKCEIPIEQLHSCFAESLFPSTVFQKYGPMIIHENFIPAGFKLFLGLKDINLFLDEANTAHVPSPIADLLHERLLTAMANKREEMDWSAIALTAMEEAGVFPVH
jgi:3-hydroxyisobutyrate dehydrogenase-like beta-hydroxyacid dehydrogenase